MIENFYSRGKLLLTGEYLVLYGAKALAMPVNLGQGLKIEINTSGQLNWQTLEKGKVIFSANFNLIDLSVINGSNVEKSSYISKLLLAIRKIEPNFLSNSTGFKVTANIEFNMQWGFGTSSTLINNLAQWAKINPFELNHLVSKGSGYDIACASADTPITFQLLNAEPEIKVVEFEPSFLGNLTLVYLNKKMATENNILDFMKNGISAQLNIQKMNALTENFIQCISLPIFMELMEEHELLVSSVLNQTPVKQLLFSDFEGAVKSLGAWGGDFVLAASKHNFETQRQYFKNKGYSTVIPLKNAML